MRSSLLILLGWGGGNNKTKFFSKDLDESRKKDKKYNAPAGNRTRVCTVAGYYSTTRPLVLDDSVYLLNNYIFDINKIANVRSSVVYMVLLS